MTAAGGLLVVLVAVGCGASAEEQARESLQIALSAHAAGNIEAARDAYQETLNNDPTNAFALYNLAILRANAGDLEEAVTISLAAHCPHLAPRANSAPEGYRPIGRLPDTR